MGDKKQKKVLAVTRELAGEVLLGSQKTFLVKGRDSLHPGRLSLHRMVRAGMAALAIRMGLSYDKKDLEQVQVSITYYLLGVIEGQDPNGGQEFLALTDAVLKGYIEHSHNFTVGANAAIHHHFGADLCVDQHRCPVYGMTDIIDRMVANYAEECQFV